jgi:hypothetical protein
MLRQYSGGTLPLFNRNLVFTVLGIAAAGAAFGAAVLLLLGQSAVL